MNQDDVYNTYDRLFVGGFLKTLIDRVHNTVIIESLFSLVCLSSLFEEIINLPIKKFAYKIGTVEKLLQFFVDLCIGIS